MTALFLTIAAFFLLITFAFLYLYTNRLNDAIKKYVLPKFKSKGLKLIRYEPVEIGGIGDFRPKDVSSVSDFIFMRGNPATSQLVNLYYKDVNSGTEGRVTLKIDMLFFRVRKITYSKTL